MNVMATGSTSPTGLIISLTLTYCDNCPYCLALRNSSST